MFCQLNELKFTQCGIPAPYIFTQIFVLFTPYIFKSGYFGFNAFEENN